MKKKILSGIFALALLATAGYGVQRSLNNNANLSDLALANVEALANNEGSGPITISCRYADKSSNVGSGTFLWRCQDCTYSICSKINNTSTCTRY